MACRRSPNGGEAPKNEADFILYAHPRILQALEVLANIGCSNRMVRFCISLDLRREGNKLVWKKPINELAVRGKIEEFRILLQNQYSSLTEEDQLCVHAVTNNIAGIITEGAREVGGKIVR